MDLGRFANKYFNDQEPWKSVKNDNQKCATTLNLCLQTIHSLAILMHPVLPFTAQKVWNLLNLSGDVEDQNWNDAANLSLAEGHLTNKPKILFTKIEDNMIEKEIIKLENAGEDIAKMKGIYDERRQYMVKRLKELGLGITVEPTGAFYVFANAKHISNDSYKLAFDILEEAHVGVTPGIDFGSNGEGYLRFSYANSMENITEGLNRIEKYLNTF